MSGFPAPTGPNHLISDFPDPAAILTHFYPQTENNDASLSRIEESSLQARVLSVENGVVRARLDGSVKLRHPFYPGRDDGRAVDAVLVGSLDYDVRLKRVGALRLGLDDRQGWRDRDWS